AVAARALGEAHELRDAGAQVMDLRREDLLVERRDRLHPLEARADDRHAERAAEDDHHRRGAEDRHDRRALHRRAEEEEAERAGPAECGRGLHRPASSVAAGRSSARTRCSDARRTLARQRRTARTTVSGSSWTSTRAPVARVTIVSGQASIETMRSGL